MRGHPHQTGTARELTLINRQRTKPLHVPLLSQITAAALAELPGVTGWDLTFYLVGAKQMAEINETHLHHEGPTDVITFDYSEPGARNPEPGLHGEIFICVPVAVTQAREFRTTWQAEIVRYIVHALLHLRGHDDRSPALRRRMKRVENRLMQKLARRFRLAAIAR